MTTLPARKTGLIARNRWRKRQLNEVRDWRRFGARGEPWFGFDAGRDLDGLLPEILTVPLLGHLQTYAGCAIRGGHGRWLLHACNAYFYHDDMRASKRHCTPAHRACQLLMEVDARSRLNNQERLRALPMARRDELTITCTHDPVELERWIAGSPL